MARDRLWQMEILRRVSAGRVSEVVGIKALEVDKLMRILLIRKTAEKYLQNHQIEPEIQELCYSFLNGINHYIENYNLPIEFTILGFKPEKWTMADMLSIGGFISFTFAEAPYSRVLTGTILTDFGGIFRRASCKAKMDQSFKNFNGNKTTRISSEWHTTLTKVVDNFAQTFGLFMVQIHGSYRGKKLNQDNLY